MTFKQAKRKLKEEAKGQYHSIKYDLSEHSNGDQTSDCTLYVAHRGMHNAPTWEHAFALLLNEQPDMKEAP